ncbi:MAG: radical SAM protein [Candidatus Aenigmarchaeota archaeon]|nr:radical SAM protein [Candidatus Aenigmarchaeota archaeon]
MELKYESSIEKLSREKKVIFEPGVKFFYKFDYAPEEIWINKEILVQLNITPKCPLNCSFCYIKNRYNYDLDFNKILKLFNNLEKYYKELDIVYRINLTGGDIFYYYKIEELLILLRDLEYVIAVDLLINRFWNNKTKKILEIIMDKVTYIQMNVSVIKEEDLEYAKNMKKLVLLKYPIYKLSEKKLVNKIVDISIG